MKQNELFHALYSLDEDYTQIIIELPINLYDSILAYANSTNISLKNALKVKMHVELNRFKIKDLNVIRFKSPILENIENVNIESGLICLTGKIKCKEQEAIQFINRIKLNM